MMGFVCKAMGLYFCVANILIFLGGRKGLAQTKLKSKIRGVFVYFGVFQVFSAYLMCVL